MRHNFHSNLTEYPYKVSFLIGSMLGPYWDYQIFATYKEMVAYAENLQKNFDPRNGKLVKIVYGYPSGKIYTVR